MSEQFRAPATLDTPAGTLCVVEILFAVEPCGTHPTRGHLKHFVCDACRQQNIRRRDEWVSSSFIDDDGEDAREQGEAAMQQVKAHIRAHEIIGAWALNAAPATLFPVAESGRASA
jgi:hypothetical protein